MFVLPSGWFDNGFTDPVSGADSSIFGSVKPGKVFQSNNAFLYATSGVSGVIADSNQVLLAQLTTRGKIYFELNLTLNDSLGNTFTYVARNGADSASPGVFLSPSLIYPPVCGCNDPNFMEYNPRFACLDSSACKTRIVLGCMDPLACNFDPTANVNVPQLCCYPGLCADRDISVVCPQLGIKSFALNPTFNLYPNPAKSELTVKFTAAANEQLSYALYNTLGEIVWDTRKINPGTNEVRTDLGDLPAGLYFFRLLSDSHSVVKSFIKE